MQAEEIKKQIESELSNAKVTITGDGTHFNAIVISSAFAGKSRIEKQQLIYNILKEPLADGTLHALSIKTYTPSEWEELNTQKGS